MFKSKKGQGMVEYILIIFLVVVVVISAVKLFGGKVNTMFSETNDKIATEANVR
ncbi:MAG: Flp family type IVb pilin [Elusimicrobia bacterium]|nr:Flp family type IVb pilin [Elusimicrobiota bacterium]